MKLKEVISILQEMEEDFPGLDVEFCTSATDSLTLVSIYPDDLRKHKKIFVDLLPIGGI